MIKFTLEIKPRTKKNHGQIIHSKTGKHILLPSKPYREFEKEDRYKTGLNFVSKCIL